MVELTKYGAQTNYRIPPESTGARVAHYEHWYFKVSGLSGTLKLPASYTMTASGIHGAVHSIEAFEGGHRLLVTAHNDSPLTGFVADDSFNMEHGFGQETGQLKTWDAVYLASNAIVDAKKPDHHLAIDQLGAAAVRFSEGEPQFDAYGLMRMVEPVRLADYVFRYSTNSTNWQQKITGTGTLTHLPAQSSVALDVGTASGDSISYTTNRHHRYTPGVSHLVTMSVQLGDTGKAGCVRRWGFFNDADGMFFELSGTAFNLVVRSSATGSVVENRIPQPQWNHDRVNGTGGDTNKSLFDLDVTKQNVYWMDFQWHGAGIVRFGTFGPTGKRLIIHTVEHANSAAVPYMATATLPIRVSVENSELTGSPSRLKLTACALFKEGEVTPDGHNNNAFVRSYSGSPKTINGTEYVCVGGFRAAGTYNGLPNRKAVIPRTLNYYIEGGDAHVIIRGGTVTNGTETWATAALGSSAEVTENISGTVFAGVQASGVYYKEGANQQVVSESFNSLGNNLIANADATPGQMYTTWVKLMNPAATGTFHLTVDWVEI